MVALLGNTAICEGYFLKSLPIRDFQETNTTPQTSEDSELEGC